LSLLLYINGQLADLEPGQVIAQTRQVNDLNSLDNRQASYTNKFNLPKTAKNVKIMQFLTMPGNSSTIPYRENTCSLYSHTGECFVYNGRAVITDGGNAYECVVYDGIIDLYKAIENKTLADLGLSELSHDKEIQTIVSTWVTSNTLPYKYIVADYNGDTTATAQDMLNIDYLIPSARVSYLWKLIFDTYGVTCSGSVFNTQNFKNLWLTFPKSANAAETQTEVFSSNDYLFLPLQPPYNDYNSVFLDYSIAQTNLLANTGNRHLTVTEQGYYSIQISGNFKVTNDVILYYAKNAGAYNLTPQIPAPVVVKDVLHNNQDFSVTLNLYLNDGDSICFFLKKWGNPFSFNDDNQLEVSMVKVNTAVDFPGAFKSFSITDFLKEIVHRFGLTIFKDKYSNHYEFLTLQEVLQTAQHADWSSKFSKKLAENYLYGSYAQRNWLRYAYNDKEANYNDSFIQVNNVNLADGKDVFKSKIYAPEFIPSNIFGITTNVYKFWDREIGEDSEGEKTIKYKPLDARYYLLRAQLGFHSMSLYSDVMPQTQSTAFYYRESYNKLLFQDSVQEYYAPLQKILQNAQLITAEIWLTETDIANLDFKKLVYIEQLGGYYLLNKVNNYVPGKVTTCELVKVQYNDDEVVKAITITAIAGAGGSDGITITYVANYAVGTLVVQGSQNQQTWQNLPYTLYSTNLVALLPAGISGQYYIRILDTTNNISATGYSLMI